MPNFRYYVFGIYAILIVITMLVEEKDIDEAREILGDTAKNKKLKNIIRCTLQT